MRPYADANEARIDREAEQEQEAYDDAHDAEIDDQRAHWPAYLGPFVADYQAAHRAAEAEIARRKKDV